jgi:hypothetical protein
MTVAWLCHAGDVEQLLRLLEWVSDLGVLKNHSAVICSDAGTPFDEVTKAKTLAETIFGSVDVISNNRSITSWVEGPKSLVIAMMKWAAKNNVAFLLMDSDAIPLKPGWLDAIEVEYRQCGKPYMGHVFGCDQPGLPARLMSPIAVYPPDSNELLPVILAGHHWDVSVADTVVPKCHDTALIHNLFGEMNRPPTFAEKGIVFQPENIRPGAVVFHRNKDGTLMNLLRQRMGIPARPIPREDGEAFFQMGRYGDLILLLPAFQEWARVTGHPTIVVTSNEFGTVFDGVSYVHAVKLPHNWHLEAGLALRYAQKLYPHIVRIQLHGVGLPPATPDSLASYSFSMWERTGLLDKYHFLPLVFDRRSPEGEAALIKKWKRTDKPLLLTNFHGATSPYGDEFKMIEALCKNFGDKFEFVNVNEARGYRIYDLLGLMDVASGLITIDTSSLHLAAGARCPYIALVRQDGQAGSIPKGNCALKLGSQEAMSRFDDVARVMEAWK